MTIDGVIQLIILTLGSVCQLLLFSTLPRWRRFPSVFITISAVVLVWGNLYTWVGTGALFAAVTVFSWNTITVARST